MSASETHDEEVELAEGAEGADVAASDASPMAHALRAASAPGTLAEDVNERLLRAALGVSTDHPSFEAQPLAPAELAADMEEQARAAALRDRLARAWVVDPEAEPDDPTEPLVEIAAALRLAAHPRPLDQLAAERTLARGGLGRRHAGRARLAWGAALVTAAAAAIALFRFAPVGHADVEATLVPARSTQELFDPAEPFPREGGASDRIDRISAARRGDLRQNRFARWGIR